MQEYGPSFVNEKDIFRNVFENPQLNF